MTKVWPDKITEIDLLKIDVEQNAYWLNPIVRYSHLLDDEREAARQRWLDKLAAQKPKRERKEAKTGADIIRFQRWEVARMRALQAIEGLRQKREFREEDVNRDEAGRFSSTGGGGVGGVSGGLGGGVESVARPALQAYTGKTTMDHFKSAGVEVSSLKKDQKQFLARWDKSIGMTPAEFKSQFLAGGKGLMSLTYNAEDKMGILGQFNNAEGRNAGMYNCKVDFRDKSAYITRIEVRRPEVGSAKPLLAAQVKLYEQMGLDRVELEADENVGAYAWGRYGFTPDQYEWNKIRSRGLRSRALSLEMPDKDREVMKTLLDSDDPKSLWPIIDSPYGKDLMMSGEKFMGSVVWQGELDFRDKDSMHRFNAYVASTPEKPRASGGFTLV